MTFIDIEIYFIYTKWLKLPNHISQELIIQHVWVTMYVLTTKTSVWGSVLVLLRVLVFQRLRGFLGCGSFHIKLGTTLKKTGIIGHLILPLTSCMTFISLGHICLSQNNGFEIAEAGKLVPLLIILAVFLLEWWDSKHFKISSSIFL